MLPEELNVDYSAHSRLSREQADAEAKQKLEEHGGFLAQGLIEPELISSIQHDIKRLIELRAEYAGVEIENDQDGISRFDDGFMALNRLNRQHGSVIYQALPRITPVHQLSVHPELIRMSKELMDTDLIISCVTKAARIDQPDEDKYLFQWHQDYPYIQDSEDGIVYWIPLHDVDESNGYLTLALSSHKAGILPMQIVDPDNASNNRAKIMEIADQSVIDTFEHIRVPVKAGDVLVFNTLTLHASNPNRSSRARWTVQIRHGNFANKHAIARDWPGTSKEGYRFEQYHPEYSVM